MTRSNQPLAACTITEAIGDGAGEGVLESTPALWLAAFTAATILVSVSYRYGSRSFSGAIWAMVSTSGRKAPGLYTFRYFRVVVSDVKYGADCYGLRHRQECLCYWSASCRRGREPRDLRGRWG